MQFLKLNSQKCPPQNSLFSIGAFSLSPVYPGTMDPPRPYRSSGYIFRILLVAFPVFFSFVSSHEVSLVVGESNKLQLSPSLQVLNSPGTKPGTSSLCSRVHIHGLARIKNLDKFSHSLKVNLSCSSSSLRQPKVEVCFHRNASLGIGRCPQGKWEKVDKGSWARAMSAFDHKLLDIRMAGSSSENVELSIKEEFFLYRVIFLIFGILLLSMASSLSKSLAFYYGSAMTIGIFLVVLVILFQGMKLLPTGRKNSLAIFIYSSLVGLGSFLLRYLPALLRSILVEMGISEDMYYPLALFLVAFVVLAGAWMGFWAVRKLVLKEDGSVDISTANFVAWSIRCFAAVMILQSSLDPLLAAEALISGIIISSILRRVFRVKFLRRLYKKSLKLVKSIHLLSDVPDLSPFGGSPDKYGFRSPDDSKINRSRPKRFTLASSNSPMQDFSRKQSRELADLDVYPSAIHRTPERRKFSKGEWEKFTKDSTRKAVQELVLSPDFSQWAAANAERITVTPLSIGTSAWC
ncbi:hypothetical protein K2173_002535 [Erythroxylum novogranatense]|uniref:Uncharacterized protein n=1 Tax=Erythroxylum novogranatense TaxID=1862640 RepID=A0AAV8TQU1_9ROSI|nr:hypothetical protein K2173_002535 [Erythroxylum novogranatense]